MKISRTELLKTKGQLCLPSLNEEQLSTTAIDQIQTTLAKIIANKYTGGTNNETTN